MSIESEDAETQVSEVVTDYHLEDEEERPICFSALPIKLSENVRLSPPEGRVYLHGSIDDGLQKIFEQVVAWKVCIQSIHPRVWVLCKDQRWFKIKKPRKAYEPTVRSILLTLECLCYLRRNPNSSDRSLWEYLKPIFRRFTIEVSKNDLASHLRLLKLMMEKYEELSKSELLSNYLRELPRLHLKKFKKVDFIDGDNGYRNQKLKKVYFIDGGDGYHNDNESDYHDDGGSKNDDANDSLEDGADKDHGVCSDTVCAICDDGGEVLCCEGECLRSFHATKDAAGPNSGCKTLGYTRAEVEEMPNFLCPNCRFKQHQCFSCGKLGISDGINAEVYRCMSRSCGHYYHSRCVASLIHPKNKDRAADLEIKIASGVSFTCTAHKCMVCNEVENKNVKKLQFAMCRRCPQSYHRKCLPREISFEDRPEEGIKQRAWDGLIPDRILIYCRKHVVDESINTPPRDHILFPEAFLARVKDSSNSHKLMGLGKRKLEDSSWKVSKTRYLTCSDERKRSSAWNVHDSCKKSSVRALPSKELSWCDGEHGLSSVKSISSRVQKIGPSEENVNLTTNHSEENNVEDVPFPNEKVNNELALAKREAKKRIMQFVENAPAASATSESSLKKRRALNNAFHIDKKIPQGMVEGSVEAICTALKKLENGCSIEDAKAVCGPDVLKQIVDRVHWYVRSGDTIVDFSCGTNDFNLLMREKLEERGNRCFFKNYDIIPPSNDFNFENKDCMEIYPRELPPGDQLIMALNVPFGVKGAHANKFIDRALEFKAKLIILIVPKDTERLDQKPHAYDLIWEDEAILSGKSIYLPGSIGVKDKQMDQWNNNPPSLYLWSHPNWMLIHRDIATKHGHVIAKPGDSQLIMNAELQIPQKEEYLVSGMHSPPCETDHCKDSVDPGPLEHKFHAKDTTSYEADNYLRSVDILECDIKAKKMAGFSEFSDQNQVNSDKSSNDPLATVMSNAIGSLVCLSEENCCWPQHFASSDGGWVEDW